METWRTDQQDDSGERLTGEARTRSAHLRVVYGRADTAVYDLDAAGVVIGRDCDGVCIDDDLVSRRHVRVLRTVAGWYLEDLGSRNGCCVDGRKFAPGASKILLGDGALIRIGDSLLVFRSTPAPPSEAASPALLAAFPGVSPHAREVRRRLAVLSTGTGHVLVLGETGTGKERAARAIAGGRPVTALDCGVLKGELARSELFGHAKNAFSGASSSRPGLVAAAKDGVLFLDEIGNLNLEVQAELLRFLEDGTYRSVGDEHEMRSKVRTVAATNADLDLAVQRGGFRSDVLARLRASHAPLELPALRDRREDVADWSVRFALEAGLATDRLWEAGALECLMLFPWPENLRELRRVVCNLVENVGPPPWQTKWLPDEIYAHRRALRGASVSVPMPPRVTLTREMIEAALLEANGNMLEVAKQLKVERTKLYRLCNDLQIPYDEYRVATQPED